MITFPLWFMIFLGWFLFIVILGILNYSMRDKYIHRLMGLSSERKLRLLKSHMLIIKIYKIFFYVSPFYLIAIPFLVYKYSKQDFFHITVLQVLLYVLILKDFLYRKFMAEKLKENQT